MSISPLLAVVLAVAGTIHVDAANTSGPWDGSADAPFATVQEGLDAAASGELVLVQPGTYTESVDFLGKDVELASAAGAVLTTLQGAGAGPVVRFVSGEGAGAVLRGFTVTGGGGMNGGGVQIMGAGPTLLDNRIHGNTVAGSGGGVFCFQATPHLAGNLIEDNTADYSGGGLNLTQSTGVVVGNVFRGNVVGKRGGGVRIHNNSTAILAGNLIVDNQAPYGGGLSGAGGTIVNNVLAGNHATEYGGGVFWSNGDYALVNNTVVGNSAALGGGGLCSGYAATASVRNTVVWDNHAPTGPDLWVGDAESPSSVAFSRCVLQGGPAAAFVAPGSALGWPAGNLTTDPQLDADFRPLPGSPCVDSGATASLPADVGDLDCDGDLVEPVPLDLAGHVRSAGPTDRGAYESGAGLPTERWTALGGGLAGGTGVPHLTGGGTLCAGDPVELRLAGAAPGASSTLVLGSAALHAPFKGGTLVPAPTLLLAGLVVQPDGTHVLAAPWPDGVPAGATLWAQHWIVDAGGPLGFAASTALSATTPSP